MILKIPLLSGFCGLIILFMQGCSPIPVSVGKHRSETNVTTDLELPLSRLEVRSSLDPAFAEKVADALTKIEHKMEILDGPTFVTAISDSLKIQLPVSLDVLINDSARAKLKQLDIDYLVVLEPVHLETYHQRIYATVIDYRKQGVATSAQIESEGELQAFWPPLPYIALFILYSAPDVSQGSAQTLGKLLHLITTQSGVTNPRVLLLQATGGDTLTSAYPATEVVLNQNQLRSRDAWTGKTIDPLQMYRDMINASRESDDPMGASMRYNPLYHAIVLPSVILIAPMLWGIDKIFDEPGEKECSFRQIRRAINSEQWLLAYRGLEACLDQDVIAVERAQREFQQHPDILTAAKKSFSVESIQARADNENGFNYVDEVKRLTIYERVAPRNDYLEALENVKKVYGNQPDQG